MAVLHNEISWATLGQVVWLPVSVPQSRRLSMGVVRAINLKGKRAREFLGQRAIGERAYVS